MKFPSRYSEYFQRRFGLRSIGVNDEVSLSPGFRFVANWPQRFCDELPQVFSGTSRSCYCVGTSRPAGHTSIRDLHFPDSRELVERAQTHGGKMLSRTSSPAWPLLNDDVENVHSYLLCTAHKCLSVNLPLQGDEARRPISRTGESQPHFTTKYSIPQTSGIVKEPVLCGQLATTLYAAASSMRSIS